MSALAHMRSSQKVLSLVCYKSHYRDSELLCVEVFQLFQKQAIGQKWSEMVRKEEQHVYTRFSVKMKHSAGKYSFCQDAL